MIACKVKSEIGEKTKSKRKFTITLRKITIAQLSNFKSLSAIMRSHTAGWWINWCDELIRNTEELGNSSGKRSPRNTVGFHVNSISHLFCLFSKRCSVGKVFLPRQKEISCTFLKIFFSILLCGSLYGSFFVFVFVFFIFSTPLHILPRLARNFLGFGIFVVSEST